MILHFIFVVKEEDLEKRKSEFEYVKKMAQFYKKWINDNFDIDYEIEYTIPPVSIINIPISLNTPDIETENDESIIYGEATDLYKIKDAGNFLFKLRNPELTVKDMAESVVREVVALTVVKEPAAAVVPPITAPLIVPPVIVGAMPALFNLRVVMALSATLAVLTALVAISGVSTVPS